MSSRNKIIALITVEFGVGILGVIKQATRQLMLDYYSPRRTLAFAFEVRFIPLNHR